MLSEQVLFSLNDIRETFLKEAEELLERRQRGNRRTVKRNTVRTVLLAAALALLLAACGWAVYHATMSWREPDPGDDLTYYLNGMAQDGNGREAEKHLDLNFGECAMALHFNTQKEGYAHGFRLHDLRAPCSAIFLPDSCQFAL